MLKQPRGNLVEAVCFLPDQIDSYAVVVEI
jgi:hypothetical protein